MQGSPVPPLARPRLPDPARDAARLLAWLGLALLMVGVPLVGLLSRRALLVLLPVGVAVLSLAAILSLSGAGLRAFGAASRSPIGLAIAGLAGWALLSCAWTAYPEYAVPLCLEVIALLVLTAAVIAHIPERRPRATLFLLPAGLAATAALTLGLLAFGPPFFRGGTEFDPSLLERSMLTLVVLAWPAMGALVALLRWRLAAGLAILVVAVGLAAKAALASAAFGIGAVTFALAVERPRRAARPAAFGLAALLVLGPVLPFVLAPLAEAVPPVGRSTVAAMADWRAIVAGDPVRLITGHGLDSAQRGVMVGLLPPHTPRTILFTLWYDLGVLGVLAFAAAFGLAFEAAGRAAAAVAPFLLAGLAVVLTVAVVGVATAEIWYVTLVALQAIAFGLLARSSRSGLRPHIAAQRPGGEATETRVAVA